MDLYRATEKELIDKAQTYSDKVDELDECGWELHLESSAYSPFEYNWRQNELEVEVHRNIGRIHYINEVLIKRHCTNLPISILCQLEDRCTSNDTYGKCMVCGGDIEDASHVEPIVKTTQEEWSQQVTDTIFP